MNPGLYLDAILLKSSRDFVKNSRKAAVMSNHVYKMGDDLYKQADGAPAGSEYAGIIARAVTRSFDRRYLKLTAERGLNVLMYGRYIDDIDQIIEKPSEEDDEKSTSEKFRNVANECCDNIIWEDKG